MDVFNLLASCTQEDVAGLANHHDANRFADRFAGKDFLFPEQFPTQLERWEDGGFKQRIPASGLGGRR
jgi:hypothetical protein